MPSIYIMIELCYFSLDQWEIKIHPLWGICFNIPYWPSSYLTNGRLQHIKELVRLGACDPHLDQTKPNDLLPLTIDGVLNLVRDSCRTTKIFFFIWCQCISHQEVKIRSGVTGPSLTILSSSATHFVYLVKDESHNQSVFQTFFLIASLQQDDFNCG